MRHSFVWSALLALAVAFGSSATVAVAADEEKPAAADKGDKAEMAKSDEKVDKTSAVYMVFDQNHLANLEPGKEIVYKFNRAVSNPDLLGQAFSDDITLKVTAAKPDGGKDVDLQIYTGDRARDLQQMPDRLHNPVFLVYFNQAVNTYSQLAGGKSPYLTRVFSTGFKDKAKVEPIKVEYDGKQIDAYRIKMKPYLGDQNEAKMQGWEGAEYTLVLSDQVPGDVVDLISRYKNKYPGGLDMVERITLDGASGLEDIKIEEVKQEVKAK